MRQSLGVVGAGLPFPGWEMSLTAFFPGLITGGTTWNDIVSRVYVGATGQGVSGLHTLDNREVSEFSFS